MLRWSINLFRVRGIQIAVHVSFLALLAWAAYEGYQDGGAGGAVWESLLLLGFFTCIVLHELGHSLTAMRYGVGVRRILLMPIGGMAEFDSIPRSPRQELWITVAGPAVNFVIAALLWVVTRDHGLATAEAGDLPRSLLEFAAVLMWWNIYIGFFNLVPAFPMDGGRILRACLAFKLPYLRATFWAATIGKIVAGVGILGGVYLAWAADTANERTHAWILVALFAFILSVGEMEYRAVRFKEQRDAEWDAVLHRLERAQRGEIPPEPPLLGRN